MTALITEDHRLDVLDEPPVCGRDANVAAWTAYFAAYPDYLIYRRVMSQVGSNVAVLGTTTGSHRGLPPELEMKRTVIWLADVTNGALSRWQVREDSSHLRVDVGISTSA